MLFLIGVAVFVNYSFRRIFDHDRNISISISENDKFYKIDASYSRYKSKRVQQLMDARLNQNHVFTNARIDGMITLDDSEKTHFYVNLHPGSLYIKLDKTDNDVNSYLKMKDLAEQLKQKLGGE